MSSPPPPMRSRSASRGRSHTRSRSRSRTRSPSRSDHSRRRGDRSYRSRSYSHHRSRTPSRSRYLSPGAVAARSSKVVIEKLTKNVQAAHLREIFSPYGDISDLDMPMNKHLMTNKGIAYVLYASPQGAEEAISHMHEAQLDGALISVSIVLPRRRFSRSPPAMRPPPNRFGEPHRLRDGPAGGRGGGMGGGDRGYGRGPGMYRGGPGMGRRGSPPRGPPPGRYRDRYDDGPRAYRPRSYSRSPPPRRRRSVSYTNRSRSPARSSPRRRDASPPRGRGKGEPGRSTHGSRSRSRDGQDGRRNAY